MDIMVKPITMEDEDRWDALVRDELSGGTQNKGAYSGSQYSDGHRLDVVRRTEAHRSRKHRSP